MVNSSGKSRLPRLIPDLGRRVFNLSLLSMMLAVNFSYVPFIMLRKFPSLPSFLSVLIVKGCCILSSDFSVSVEMVVWDFSCWLDCSHLKA